MPRVSFRHMLFIQSILMKLGLFRDWEAFTETGVFINAPGLPLRLGAFAETGGGGILDILRHLEKCSGTLAKQEECS